MKKLITIICDKDVPIARLLNDNDFQVLKAVGEEEIFTMIAYEKNEQPNSSKNK